MSSRYALATQLQNSMGKRRISSLIIPNIPRSSNDIYIQTTSVERLDKLAYSFYQDESFWWIIATANGLGKGSYIVPANTTLRIPSKNGALEYVVSLNRAR